MKKEKRIVALAMAALMLMATLTACVKAEVISLHNPEDMVLPSSDGVIMELSWEMVPLTASPAISSILTPTAPGTLVKSNAKAIIDYSNTADGYVMVKFSQSTSKRLKVTVKGPSGVQYQYNLNSKGDFDVFPLSDGNGSYSIGVFEQTEGNKYAAASSATVDVKLKDEFAPFLRPNQYVNFNENSNVVKKAAELTKGKSDFYDKVNAIYEFVIGNITYDTELAKSIQSGSVSSYLPVVDDVMAKGKGICFDYAALMTAMLRSLDIPTKLVVGYAGQQYHAWINVYSEKEGWVSVIQFDGKSWKLVDPTFMAGAKNASQAEKMKDYIGDGKSYSACYLY